MFGYRYSFFSLFRDERLGKYLQLLVNKFFHTGPPGGARAIVYFSVMSHLLSGAMCWVRFFDLELILGAKHTFYQNLVLFTRLGVEQFAFL